MKTLLTAIFIIIISGIAFLGYHYFNGNAVGLTANVDIAQMNFHPVQITVKPHTEVTFTNNDGIPHAVTADDNSFDSGTISPGMNYKHTFSSTGTYPYHCSFYPYMKGKIIVK